MSKYIIGGGISGLIWNFYNQDYKIITPDVGGVYGKTHMVWLHDTPETRQFLKDLGFEQSNCTPKKSYIGYYHNGWIRDYIDADMNRLLIQKKMTEWDKPINVEFEPDSSKLSMGDFESTNYMNTLDVDLIQVIEKLREFSTVEHGFVTKITDHHIFVKDKMEDEETQALGYDKLVSTIAAPFFWMGYGEDKEFGHMPITNVITSVRPEHFDDRYEMIYYDDSVPYSRASFLDGKYALEFSGTITEEQFTELFPDLPIEEFFVVKQGRIFKKGENLPPKDNIMFLGRFAEWEHGITTEHVVQKTLKMTGKF
jgi:hypothetical protein